MSSTVPQICHLSHPGFRMLGEPTFRLSEGTRIPSMVIKLDGQDAVLPLQSLAREFQVDPASADGQMLILVEQALEFVASLKLGDKLPTELSCGEASWDPSEQDRRVAASRVRHNLVRCVFARLGKTATITCGGAPGWEDDPKNRALLAQAITGAAALLDGVDEPEIIARVASISDEMASIETMRRSLTRGIASVKGKLLQLALRDVPISQQETVKQVQALAGRGIKEITNRFDRVDLRLDDIVAMLRDIQPGIVDLRRHRDWLFRTDRAWAPVFVDWAGAPKHFDDFFMRVVERSYGFLAPRYMSFQEWTVADPRVTKKTAPVKVW